MSIKFDESMTRILWAIAITGFALSLPFAIYYALRYGFSTVVLAIPFANTIGAYVLVAAAVSLWVLCFLISRIIKIVFDGMMPQEGDETLTWPQSFMRAAVLLAGAIVFFAVLFPLVSGGRLPIGTILEKHLSKRYSPAKEYPPAPAVEAPAAPAAPAVEAPSAPAMEADDVSVSGFTNRELADYLAQKANFNIVGAREAGYTDKEIIEYLMTKDSLPPARDGY